MSKIIAATIVTGLLLAGAATAQNTSGSLLNQPILSLPAGESQNSAKPEKKPAGKPAENKRKGATEITSSKETQFSQKPPVITFVGDVIVKDPQFDLKADKMTVYLKEKQTEDAKTSGTKAPQTKPNGDAKPANAKSGETETGDTKPAQKKDTAAGSPNLLGNDQDASSLDRVIAEGNVVIVASRPGEKEGEVTKYVARSEKAVFESKSGDLVLTGSPQVQQGINTHVATDPSTVMYINRNGTFRTVGRAKTVIQEQPEDTNIK